LPQEEVTKVIPPIGPNLLTAQAMGLNGFSLPAATNGSVPRALTTKIPACQSPYLDPARVGMLMENQESSPATSECRDSLCSYSNPELKELVLESQPLGHHS